MKLQVIKIRDAAFDTFWLLPALMALLAAGAALASTAIDSAIDSAVGNAWLRDMSWVCWKGPKARVACYRLLPVRS